MVESCVLLSVVWSVVAAADVVTAVDKTVLVSKAEVVSKTAVVETVLVVISSVDATVVSASASSAITFAMSLKNYQVHTVNG